MHFTKHVSNGPLDLNVFDMPFFWPACLTTPSRRSPSLRRLLCSPFQRDVIEARCQASTLQFCPKGHRAPPLRVLLYSEFPPELRAPATEQWPHLDLAQPAETTAASPTRGHVGTEPHPNQHCPSRVRNNKQNKAILKRKRRPI